MNKPNVTKVFSWGSDEEVIRSARMSTDGAFRGWGTPEAPGDEKLLRFLWENHHATPFEFGGMCVEIECPIFVVRQIQRHRAASYNELSARYVEMDDDYWMPEFQEIRFQGGKNKQGSIIIDSPEKQKRAVQLIKAACDGAFAIYNELVNELGIAREQARTVLPMGTTTRFRMQCNLRMWIHFLGLRLDPHAQKETRDVAQACYGFLKECFPRTLEIAGSSWHRRLEGHE